MSARDIPLLTVLTFDTDIGVHYNFTCPARRGGYDKGVWRIAIIAALVCSLVPIARADQCQWLEDKQVADRAVAEVSRAGQIVSWCEPCGEKTPGAPTVVTSATVSLVKEPEPHT